MAGASGKPVKSGISWLGLLGSGHMSNSNAVRDELRYSSVVRSGACCNRVVAWQEDRRSTYRRPLLQQKIDDLVSSTVNAPRFAKSPAMESRILHATVQCERFDD
jgi:hypothetical protein